MALRRTTDRPAKNLQMRQIHIEQIIGKYPVTGGNHPPLHIENKYLDPAQPVIQFLQELVGGQLQNILTIIRRAQERQHVST